MENIIFLHVIVPRQAESQSIGQHYNCHVYDLLNTKVSWGKDGNRKTSHYLGIVTQDLASKNILR